MEFTNIFNAFPVQILYFVLDFFQTCSTTPSHHKTLLPGVVTSCEIATKSDQPLARSQSTICSWQQKSYQSEKPPQIKSAAPTQKSCSYHCYTNSRGVLVLECFCVMWQNCSFLTLKRKGLSFVIISL